MTVADTIWTAVSALEQAEPAAPGFTREAITRKVLEIDPTLNVATVAMHLSQHCVASKPAQPSNLRMLTKNADGTLRLFREGDPFHESRRGGRTRPKISAVPPGGGQSPPASQTPGQDAILALSGVGQDMWRRLGGGDQFIRAMREEVFPVHNVNDTGRGRDTATRFQDVWQRIVMLEGTEFRTIRNEPFAYEVRGNAVVPRPGKGTPANRQLPMSDFEKALRRWPVSGPGELHDLQGPSYIFGILSDSRVAGR